MNAQRAWLFALSLAWLCSAAEAAPPFVATEDVPLLAGEPGTLPGYQFSYFEFDMYVAGFGDPGDGSDYLANVVANDQGDYTYLQKSACVHSGRGGGPCPPPTYLRVAAHTYSDTYITVTRPPAEFDINYHFSISADDLGGRHARLRVTGAPILSAVLTSDGGGAPVSLDDVLADGAYTLHLHTSSAASTVVLEAVPEPEVPWLLLCALPAIGLLVRRR